MSEYIRKVYGTARALLDDGQGGIREATPEECRQIGEMYAKAIADSFVEVGTVPFKPSVEDCKP